MQKCKTCKFWFEFFDGISQQQLEDSAGTCRANPPVLIQLDRSCNTDFYGGAWPTTHNDDWCGAYQSKAEHEAKK